MSGRRYGEYYTPILAWDHSSYAYSSLKVDRTINNNADDENIVSCRRTDPDSADFYFALVQELMKIINVILVRSPFISSAIKQKEMVFLVLVMLIVREMVSL